MVDMPTITQPRVLMLFSNSQTVSATLPSALSPSGTPPPAPTPRPPTSQRLFTRRPGTRPLLVETARYSAIPPALGIPPAAFRHFGLMIQAASTRLVVIRHLLKMAPAATTPQL